MPDLNPTTPAGKPVAWIDNSGHPRHLSYVQSVRERQLYGPLRPLYDQAAIDAAIAQERASHERALAAALADAQMVNDRLRQQMAHTEARYMELLKAVADGVAMQRSPNIVVVLPEAPTPTT